MKIVPNPNTNLSIIKFFVNLLAMHSDPKAKNQKVVIVGAGAAGLQASRLLREASISVVLLEARDRIGGRIHTSSHSLTNVSGNQVTVLHDEGAAWVHGIGYAWPADETATTTISPSVSLPNNIINPMLALLQEAAGSPEALWERELKPMFPTGNPWMRPKTCLFEDGQLAIYHGGKLLTDDLLIKSLERHFKIMDQVDDIGQTLLETDRQHVTLNQSLQDTVNRVLKRKESQRQRKVKDYMKLEQLRQFYVHLIELWYAGPADRLQLSEFIDFDESLEDGDISYTGEGDFFGPHCTVTSGMASLLKPLINHGEQIMTGQEVVSIQEKESGVLVQTKSGFAIEADACIVAMPLACIKANSGTIFQPKLSADKRESLDILRVGQYKKVFLAFNEIFWSPEPAFVGFLLPESASPLGKHLLADNLWARDGIPCLEVVLTSGAAAWAMHKPDDVIRDTVLAFLTEAVHATMDLQCSACHITRWEEDPFSLGAYSTFGIGCDEKHTAALRQPEWNGKLVFAGEHTISEFEGSVHAALFSGYNSARAVCEYLATKVDARN